jgi:photosystem II stability/assembly factor-like uncharacterized protein
MTPQEKEERELRRALDSRSAGVTPEFRAKLSSALAEGRPASNFLPALAAVAGVVLVFATVGVLLLARQARNEVPPVAASTPTATPTSTPSPDSSPSPEPTPTPAPGAVAGILVKPSKPIPLPADASLSAPSSSVVWALMGDQYLYRSGDRGATWHQKPLPPNFMSGFPRPQISFVSDQEGWLSTGGSPETQCNAEMVTIWHTTDAGTTWQSLGTKGVSDSQCKGELSFVDASRGFIDGSDPNRPPVIYHTANGGKSWAGSKPLPDPPGFRTGDAGFTLQPGRVSAFGSTLLVAASMNDSNGIHEFVFRSTDGGANWTYLASAKDSNNQVDFVTATRWLELIAPGQSVETTDAGASWHRYASAYSQAAPIAADFVFADSTVGYGTVRGEISRTVDGGLHWTRIHSPGT